MSRLAVSMSLVLLLVTVFLPGRASARSASGCHGIDGGDCGVHAGSGSQEFVGLLAVSGSPWVFADAATAGSEPGCGDCVWTIALACADEKIGEPTTCLLAVASSDCAAGQRLYRVYLTTNTESNVVQGVVCIGGADQPVDVGGQAVGDVERYLRDVTPPDLEVVTRPAQATLAGLPTYFSARPPADLRPTPFGGGDITETITIAPARTRWTWGDGEASAWADPTAAASHTYSLGGTAHGSLATRWGASYTVTYGGVTVGPYPAVGQITKQQPFGLAVLTSQPALVSH